MRGCDRGTRGAKSRGRHREQATASRTRADKNPVVDDATPDVVVRSVAELVERHPDLRGALVVELDLRAADLDWARADVEGAAFLGCRLRDGIDDTLRAGGAIVLGPLDHVGFQPYRDHLYSNDELMVGYVPGQPETTLDARIGVRAQEPQVPATTLARGIHDSTIDAALTRFLDDAPGPVVGVMGSHSSSRADAEYRLVALLGRALTRAGYVVATGGGPGLMEAANLGGWLAREADDVLEDALEILGRAPSYDVAPAPFLDAALEVRRRWPDGATSLGVPTWLYVDEPLNQFSTHIAKYFQNSIRENGLLAIALGGVVYAPGGIGTAQEIFTDAAQNGYTMYDVRSPMVFFRSERWDTGLVDAVRVYAQAGGWEHLVRVVDEVDDVVAAVDELAPRELPRPPRKLPLRKR